MKDLAYLFLRLAVGINMLAWHGLPKLVGGPERWAKVGANMGQFGLGFAPGFWGLCAALAESLGSLFLILGLFFRPSAAFLAFTMFVATFKHGVMEGSWKEAEHAMQLMAVYLFFVAQGPGVYTLKSGGEK